MTRRRLLTSLVVFVAVVVGALFTNLLLGNRPVLGLDLQGGVSVILSPTEGAGGDDLLVIRDLIRDELEQRGIAEPDVRVEGSNIVVDLPGVKDQQDALDAVDVAGIVTLRPVLACVEGETPSSSVPTGSTTPGTGTTAGTGTAAGRSATTPSTPSTDTVAGTAVATTNGGPAGESRSRTVPPTGDTATPNTAAATPSTAAETPSSAPTGTVDPTATTAPTGSTTPPAQDGTEVLPLKDGGLCQVGPAGGTGEVFSRNSARADLIEGGWGVVADLSSSGNAAWNELAAQCYYAQPTCPSQRLAIVLDDIIQSAPTVNAPSFDANVSITGSFAEGEARSLARVLNRGAFPVDVQAQSVETVSPTLGGDSLRAAVISGLVGLFLVLCFLVVFYRSLTALILAGMLVWGMLIYSVSSLISEATNYALTLAGVTGIIISVGVTVDSYVVYFERLKDEARHGRTLRNSAARGFTATWRTIVAADLVSMIGAAVLFLLSVGSVRGFALYLGITTACDLIVCYFFTRPAVILLALSGRLDRWDPFGLGAAP